MLSGLDEQTALVAGAAAIAVVLILLMWWIVARGRARAWAAEAARKAVQPVAAAPPVVTAAPPVAVAPAAPPPPARLPDPPRASPPATPTPAAAAPARSAQPERSYAAIATETAPYRPSTSAAHARPLDYSSVRIAASTDSYTARAVAAARGESLPEPTKPEPANGVMHAAVQPSKVPSEPCVSAEGPSYTAIALAQTGGKAPEPPAEPNAKPVVYSLADLTVQPEASYTAQAIAAAQQAQR